MSFSDLTADELALLDVFIVGIPAGQDAPFRAMCAASFHPDLPYTNPGPESAMKASARAVSGAVRRATLPVYHEQYPLTARPKGTADFLAWDNRRTAAANRAMECATAAEVSRQLAWVRANMVVAA